MTKWTRAKRLTTLGTALAVAMSMLAGPAAAADPATAQDIRTTIIKDITSLLPTGNGDADKKLAEAVKKLTESLNEKYWSGPDELSKEGTKVFEKDRDAAKKLREAVKKLTEAKLDSAGVADALKALVAEDQRLAEAMITAAETAKASDSKIAEARKEIAKAEKELADGKPHEAIDHFKKAWEKAFKAEAEAVKAAAEAAAEASTATASTSGGGDYAVYTFTFIEPGNPNRIPFAVTGTNEGGTYGYTGRGNEGYLEVDGVKMQLHVSCSDAFTDGTGDKSDPTEASPYRVVNYTISKYKDGQLDKTCNLTGVQDYASVSIALDYSIESGEWNAGDGDPISYTFAEWVEYRFTITNSGSLALTDIALTDDRSSAVTCGFTGTLLPAESFICVSDWVWPESGLFSNTATVVANSTAGAVSASDSAQFIAQ